MSPAPLRARGGSRMTIYVCNFAHKKQTKAQDCWYACIQMLLSWKAGNKTKPRGDAVRNHRDVWALGRTLGFGSKVGERVKTDNGLVSMGHEIQSNDIESIHAALLKYGPFIIGGKYGPCGAGHFVVICGVNTDTNMVWRDNPAWGYDKAWKPLSYLEKAWGPAQPKGMIDIDSAVALKPVAA